MDRVKSTLTNTMANAPNAVVLELLCTRNRKLDILHLACIDTLCDRFAESKIPLADLVQNLRKSDSFAAFFARCLKDIRRVCFTHNLHLEEELSRGS